MTKKPVLFIVEGERTEVSVLKRINSVLECFGDYHIYSYKTAIYELYEELSMDDNLDLQLTLKSKTSNKDERRILEMRYVAVFLIFDFDPQHHKFSCQILEEMLSYFSDPIDNGKLYINYPMFESHRHLNKMPDIDFFQLRIKSEDIKNYKRIVGSVSAYAEINHYTIPIIINMISHHLCKYRFIIEDAASFPTVNDYERLQSATSHIKLLSIQENAIELGVLYVINTSLFYVIDLIPKTFFNEYSKLIY